MAPSVLSSRSVRLRPVRSTDHDWLYELLTFDAGSRWRYRGRTPNPVEFTQDLWRGVHAQFVVADRQEAPVGLVGLCNMNQVAGHCHLFAVGASDRGPLVSEAAGVLLNWAFDEYDLRKVWVEAPEFNLHQFASLTDVADIEGRLTGYDVWRGRFWDTFILSINRQRWDERHRVVLEGRRGALTPTPSTGLPDVEELEQLLEPVWPLDSLGAIEVVTELEERTGALLDVELLDGLNDLGSPAVAAAALRTRLGGVVGQSAQQSSGSCCRSEWNGQDPSTVAVTVIS
jgi:RimJ/RimL family protein N-acetyltransferase/acyl carrier protein